MAAKKDKPKSYLPGIRVSNPAWELGKRLKGLSALTGTRTTIGEIFSRMMLKNGPAMEAELNRKYDDLRKKAAFKNASKKSA